MVAFALFESVKSRRHTPTPELLVNEDSGTPLTKNVCQQSTVRSQPHIELDSIINLINSSEGWTKEDVRHESSQVCTRRRHERMVRNVGDTCMTALLQ